MSTLYARDSFFRDGGGTLDPDAPSYVPRPADDELFQLVSHGEYCNLLAARQMGKSSLMVRTAKRLQEHGISSVVLDLSALGTPARPHPWYLGVLRSLGQKAQVDVNVIRWWRRQGMSSPVQRFARFINSFILAQSSSSIVIFVDEIDSTLDLGYTDDFFAAVRAMFNERATNPEYKRLTFVLAGVARPADLIKDRNKTPYNIGHLVDLGDFDRQSAQVLAAGLRLAQLDEATSVLDRVLYWTGGHPYLTQQICGTIVAERKQRWPDDRIDSLMTSLFFLEGRMRSDRNLNRIFEYVRSCRCRQEMLQVYEAILSGESVEDEERSIEKSRLKLSGLVKADSDGYLRVRNPIYERVFGWGWIQQAKSVGPISGQKPGFLNKLLDILSGNRARPL